ncbi:PPT3 [Symbiodinium natans]|uniref:PPT3 protein n=1 Tax=Symbiodinium natans TaxID=878477 RepID=A0A812GUS2_9DINO|nr:PPT3 [Symbiodinium natans]
MPRRLRGTTPTALCLAAFFYICVARLSGWIWQLASNDLSDPSTDAFSLMFPKSYRGIPISTGTRTTMLSWSMIWHDCSIMMIFATVGYAVSYSQQRWLCVPHVVEEHVPNPPSPQSGALLAAGLYGANIAYNVINKRLLLAHPHPLLITGVNLASSSVCAILCWVCGLIRWPGRMSLDFYLRLFGLAIFHWGGMLFSNVSVSEVHISFTHTVKAAEPFFTALFTALLIGTWPSLRAWASLLLVIAGIVVASTAEISFTWTGFWAAMVSNFCVSLRTVLTKKSMDNHIMDPLNFMAHLQLSACLVSLPAALLFNVHAVRELAEDTMAWPLAATIGPLVWIFNVASIIILVHTSTVVHSMVRSMRRPLLVLASIITFGTRITPLNAFGILITLLGALWYRFEIDLGNRKVTSAPQVLGPQGSLGSAI